MSAPAQISLEVIESKQDLIGFFESGEKPKSAWRIGTEHEKFAFTWDDLNPLPYAGDISIHTILQKLVSDFGWSGVYEGGNLIALTYDGANITLEPGGQLELSGAPLVNLHQTCDEVQGHLKQIKTICDPMNVGMIGMGFAPTWTRDDMPWMPKERYKIMEDYMPKKGELGLDMMLRTTTVQANLDFSSESDMVRKFRLGLALQPIATALFANSPFYEGKPNGYVSYRSRIWEDTDPDRTGVPVFAFEGAMGYERYVDYALDVPMYFVYRDGKYIDTAGQSFRDFLKGELPALPKERPTLGDWADHLTTLFPEVRLKTYLEMRGADGGAWDDICALPAFWVGVMYDERAMSAAEDIIRAWSAADITQLRHDVPRLGLRAEIQGRSVLEIARLLLAISMNGLRARACYDKSGNDETHFLGTVQRLLDRGKTHAEVKLDLYKGPWGQHISPLFKEFCY